MTPFFHAGTGHATHFSIIQFSLFAMREIITPVLGAKFSQHGVIFKWRNLPIR